MTAIDYDQFDALTFDCYGTLIDWETGIVRALRAELGDAVAGTSDDELLAVYAAAERGAEVPYQRYRDVLATCLRAVAAHVSTVVDDAQAARFADSVGDWPAFDDSAAALASLHERFRLGVITNCDDDLFARSLPRLGVTFDWIVTAEQLGSYKPDLANFHGAHARMGVPRERILHVAQSLVHDHVPAKQLGMTTVWINRHANRLDGGPTPPAEAMPDLIVPDMGTFAELAR